MINYSYTIEKGALPDYIIDMYRMNCCPLLINAKLVVNGEGGLDVNIDPSGCMHLESYMEQSFSALMDGFFRLLSCLRRFTEAVTEAESFLIDESLVSMNPDDLFFNEKNGKARLVIKPEPENEGLSFYMRMMELLSGLQEKNSKLNTDIISEKLQSCNAEALLDKKGILRVLSSWEYELKT